jgi:FMN phosphatase YigB (HAD superfamily)
MQLPAQATYTAAAIDSPAGCPHRAWTTTATAGVMTATSGRLNDRHRPGTVVMIDLDETLIPDREAFRAAAAAVLDSHLKPRQRVTGERDVVDELLTRARTRWRASPLRKEPEALGVSSWEALWSDFDHKDAASSPMATGHAIAVWADTLAALGGDARLARSAAQMLITRREALVRPFSGVRAALGQWAVRHRLWLVTHGSSSLQRRKLHLADLSRYFDVVLISAEVGLLKGTIDFAELVQKEAARSGLSVQVVIGDSESDLTLAAHGGWPGIHICRQWPCRHHDPSVLHRRAFADCPVLPD